MSISLEALRKTRINKFPERMISINSNGGFMKHIVWLLLFCLLMTACSVRNPGGSLESEKQSNTSEATAQEEPSIQDIPDELRSADETKLPEDPLDEERLNEIMCIFGAECKIQYDENGQPMESDSVEYQTSVISFYYYEEGISSADDITPYGFFGWYLHYTLLQDEQIAKVLPGFERMTLIRNDPVSGEIYGAPGDDYEAIVTSFFNVDIQHLRSNDLYDEKAHAYVPITGPGIGERPTVRVAAIEQREELIVLDISVERNEPMLFKLTVRQDRSNDFAGIKFVSLIQIQ